MGKIIFCDIDGTLINDHLIVTNRTKQAIRARIGMGDLFVPVSARMPKAIKPLLKDFLADTPIISYNGAYIQDQNGQELSSSSMVIQIGQDICTYIESEHPSIAWNVYSGEEWLSNDRSNFWVSREEEVVGISSREIKSDDLSKLNSIHKVLLMGDPEEIEIVEKTLKERYSELSIAQSYPYYLEIMSAGIDKGQAVQELAKYFGVEMSHTIAFGDNFNDLDMLQVVGCGYLMGNAPEKLKKIIANHTADNNHDGIASVLENL